MLLNHTPWHFPAEDTVMGDTDEAVQGMMLNVNRVDILYCMIFFPAKTVNRCKRLLLNKVGFP